ncbi:TonB-dependent siderophore receptor [Methylobacterium sp. Leaf118]|uniref:TonB-dependent siderophore receptor n=1 Tax=Methylobacterium sp. Leaf118 TaxID=2876562 RepID=UPI001E2CEAEB|nr:TonB-dependent siderophore receptor [Methylobacterium sp. Leaf118]
MSLLALTLSLGTAWAQASTTLGEIAVEGQGGARRVGSTTLPGGGLPASTIVRPGQVVTEDPRGPVDGFVATRTSTATKTNTSLLETPQSVSVIGQEQIRATGAQTLTQATQYTPGVYSGVFGNDARLDWFLLRGFVAHDYGLYKDGLQLLNYGFNYFRTDPFGLERVEVLRGPSSLLFGSGTPGGMINTITKRPTAVPFGYVEAGADSFGNAYGGFDIGGPVDSSGHWFYRLTGIGRGGGTQIDAVDADRIYIAPALTYRPDGATSFTLLTSYQKDWTGVTANFLPYSGTVVPNASGLFIPRSLNVGDTRLNTFRREQAFIGYEFETALDATWTIRQNARYSFSQAFQNSFIGQLGYLAGTNETQLARYQFRDSSRVNLFQIDNQAQADFSDGLFRHTALFGVDYKNYQLHDNQASGYQFPGVPALDIVNPVYGVTPLPVSSYLIDKDSFQQLGFYAQDQIRITDRFSIIAGLRADFASTSVDKQLAPLNSTRRQDQALTYRIAGVYNFDFGLAPYVSYATSFQPQIGFDGRTGATFKPDNGEQIEVGFRYAPVGQRWILSFAAFDLTRSNPLIPIAPFITSFTQIGAVTSQGVEAQFVATLAEGLNITASVTAYDIKYGSNTLPEVAGRTPTATPQVLANVFADYTFQDGPLRGFGFGGGLRYVGSSYAVNNTLQARLVVPEYLLYDATIHYDFDNGIRASLTGANLGDDRFVSACQDASNCYYGEARRILGSISYKW